MNELIEERMNANDSRSWSLWPLPSSFGDYEEYREFLHSAYKHEGSFEAEILALLTLGPCCVVFTWSFIIWNMDGLHVSRPLDHRLLLALEFLLLLMPSLAALTFGCDFLTPMLAFVALATLGFLVVIDQREGMMSAEGKRTKSFSKNVQEFYRLDLEEQDPHKINSILSGAASEFRSLVLIVTVICILAVDFPAVFPSRFHKSDIFGSSIMDLGVGGFIVANGIVAKEARTPDPEGKRAASIRMRFWLGFDTLKSTLRSSLLLGVMGVARAVAVRLTGYHVVVTEYGVHWNFFLTLAVVRLAASAVFTVVPRRLAWVLGLSNLVMYQIFLTVFGWQRVILHGWQAVNWFPDDCSSADNSLPGIGDPKCQTDQREGFIEANREGLFSLWGFLSLYFFSVQIGRVFFREKRKTSDWLAVVVFVAGVFFLAQGFVSLASLSPWDHSLRPSRRLANAVYVLWTLSNCSYAICLTLLGKMLVIFMSFQHGLVVRPLESLLLRAINFNPLAFFLLANLLTGLVNTVLPTLLMDATSATVTLFVYLAVLTLGVYQLFRKKIKIS